MPAVDTVRNTSVRPKSRKARVRVKPKTTSPRPQGMSRTFAPSGKVNPAPKVTAPKKTVVRTKTFTTDASSSKGYRSTQQERQAVENNVAESRKRVAIKDKKVQEDARRKFGITGQREAEKKVIRSLSELRASDPAKYDRKVDHADHSIGDRLEDIGHGVNKGLMKAAEGVKSAQDKFHEHTTTYGQRQMEKLGYSPDLSKPGKEVADIVATTPASVYMTGKALAKGAGGDTSDLEKMGKEFLKKSALPPLVTGHIKEAARRANERPATTLLELSGARAIIGRGAGAAARSGALGKAAKRVGSTEREDLRLYNGKPGEGPAVARRYSKDLTVKAGQKVIERRKRKQGHDPNVAAEPRTVPNMSGGRIRVTPNVGPAKHPLDDRVDRHVHSAHVSQQQIIAAAEKKAEKRGKADEKITEAPPTPAQLAKPETLKHAPRTKLAGVDPEHVAHQAHDVLGISKPVSVQRMSSQRAAALEAEMGSQPRGYASDMGSHYRIEINHDHPANRGPKGVSNVTHYELGRVQGMDKGLDGPGPVGSHNRDAYFKNPQTAHAQAVMRKHIAKDLRNPRPVPPELPAPRYTGAVRPTVKEQAGQRAAQGALQSHLTRVVKDFAVNIGPKGHVTRYEDAAQAAKDASERLGEKMVPVNSARLLRMPKDPLESGVQASDGIRLANAHERAWRQAVENKRPGKWVLMPERVVTRFIHHAEGSRNFGPLQRSTNLFKDVVLTTSNPVRWLGGNVTDLGMRSINEGLTPADLYRGARIYKELGKHGHQGTLVKASTMGGGFGHLARDVSTELTTPGVSRMAKAWGHYRAGIYGLESAIEALPQMATVGKELRTAEHGRGSGVQLKTGLKGLLRATDEQVQAFAKDMVTDPALEMRVARHVEDVIGKWGKLSPEARRMLAMAPFAQWLGAATKYVLVTMPGKHPIKTSLMASLAQMTEEERKALGFSRFLPLGKQVQDYQMMTLPQHVGKDKYGPVVKGTDMARALSFGTVNDALGLNVGSFLFPQFSGALNAANGTSWTGEPLQYPEGHANAGMQLSVEDRRKVAAGMLLESMLPFGSTYRRVFQEKGRPSLPQSTIIDPQVRTKYNPKTKQIETPEGSLGAGAKRMIGWPIPGLPAPKRVYTKGAVNQMERSRVAVQEVKQWNADRKGHKLSSGDPEVDNFGGPGHRKNKDAELEAFGK